MQKKISIGAAIAAVLFCSLATFQVTYIALQNKFEQKYLSESITAVGKLDYSSGQQSSASISENGQQLPTETAAFIDKLAGKLAEVDSIYRQLYLG